MSIDKNRSKEVLNKKRTGILILVILLAAGAAWLSFGIGINPPMANVAGSIVSILLAVIVAQVLGVSDNMFAMFLGFVFLASPVGSVLNVYRLWGPYDKIVHFLSGVLIAAAGIVIFCKIIEQQRMERHQKKKLIGISSLFAFLAASAGAGIWEITEFTIDIIVSGGMQRGMVDTITDMIAGTLGGLLYALITYFMYRKPKSEFEN